jgi:hypothetical protein
MLKSGLIIGGVAFLLSLGAALITPLCVPCLALLLGLAAGYLAGVFDKPAQNDVSAKAGALSGSIGGVGAMLGQTVAAVANSVMLGPAGAARLATRLGLPTGNSATFGSGYWVGVIGSTCCFSALDILLMAALGALGGVIWWQISGKKPAVTNE